MNISYNWLKKYINIDLPAQDVAEILTDIGLEVEGIEQIGVDKAKLNSLKIGHIVSKEMHPNADRLNVAMVDIGEEENLQIVCGAANLEVEQKVVVATVNSKIYPIDGSEIKIKKAKLRGVKSFGMICAEDEIGIGSSHDGIMVLSEEAPVGKSFGEYFETDSDTMFTIDLTPNRADATSHYGVARDLKTYFHSDDKIQLKFPDIEKEVKNSIKNDIKIDVSDSKLCPRYSGILIKNIKVEPSPEHIQKDLTHIGIKPINNIVDITNYVLYELGQPLHVFDANKIKDNNVVVKTWEKGTKFTTLDTVERELNENDLMISDAEKPLCIAGVFGGIDSGVKENTTAIFIESAYFNSTSIRKTAKLHKLSTDASFRYERGADPEITVKALQRAVYLIKEILPNAEISNIKDVYPQKINRQSITIELDYVNRIIGQEIEAETILSILSAMEMNPQLSQSKQEIELEIPTYRVDVTRPIDIVEEIIRIYGFNKINIPDQIKIPLHQNGSTIKEELRYKISLMLKTKGFNEIMTNSLTSSNNIIDKDKSVKILNALSNELGVMRQSPIMTGLEAIHYNVNRNIHNLKLFEIGRIYNKIKSGKYSEEEQLCLFMCGSSSKENWGTKSQEVNYFDVKSILNHIWELTNSNETYQLEKTDQDLYSFSTAIQAGKKTIGTMGQVSGELLKRHDIEQDVFVLCLDFPYLVKLHNNNKIKFQEITKYPIVSRDLALLIDKNVQFGKLKTIAQKTIGRELYQIDLFDEYKGKGIPEEKKSYGLNFSFRKDESTYTDKEIEGMMNRLIKAFNKEVSAEIR